MASRTYTAQRLSEFLFATERTGRRDCAARSSLYATQAALIWHAGHRHLT